MKFYTFFFTCQCYKILSRWAVPQESQFSLRNSSSPVPLEEYAPFELWKHSRDSANETSLNASPAAGSSQRWGMSAVGFIVPVSSAPFSSVYSSVGVLCTVARGSRGSGGGRMEFHKRDSRELFAELLQNNHPLEQRHVIKAVRQRWTSLSQKNKYSAKK